ncbi:unnamed protein product, partial [Ectocarpus fasciculatus]
TPPTCLRTDTEVNRCTPKARSFWHARERGRRGYTQVLFPNRPKAAARYCSNPATRNGNNLVSCSMPANAPTEGSKKSFRTGHTLPFNRPPSNRLSRLQCPPCPVTIRAVFASFGQPALVLCSRRP